MYNGRPKIKVPSEPLDVIVEILTFGVLVLLIVYTLVIYEDILLSTMTSTDHLETLNAFGIEALLYLLPMIVVPIYILLFVLNKFSHIHNYIVNITKEKALKNYTFSTRVLRFTNLFVVAIFMVVQYMNVQSTRGISVSFTHWFTPVILIVSFVIPIFLIIYQLKINKIRNV